MMSAQRKASSKAIDESSRKLIEAVEAERRKIGRELHDNLCQRLKGLELILTSLRVGLDIECPLAERLSAIEAGFNESLNLTHAISEGMLPAGLQGQDFRDALISLAKSMQLRFNVKVSLASPLTCMELGEEVSTQLFRIAEEAMMNAICHGNAQNIAVSLTRDGGLAMCISDDGYGFEPQATLRSNRLGLRIMRVRAESIGASLSIESAPGNGTRISCHLHDPAGNRE